MQEEALVPEFGLSLGTGKFDIFVCKVVSFFVEFLEQVLVVLRLVVGHLSELLGR